MPTLNFLCILLVSAPVVVIPPSLATAFTLASHAVILPTLLKPNGCFSSLVPLRETKDDGCRERNDGSVDGDVGRANNAQKITRSVKRRRQFFSDALRLGSATTTAAAASCLCCGPHRNAALALAQITAPPSSPALESILRRNRIADAVFAKEMATGMRAYEDEARPKKAELFQKLFASLDGGGGIGGRDAPPVVVVEVGIGSFPNAEFYGGEFWAAGGTTDGPGGVDIIGIDPNVSMEQYALESARRADLVEGRGKSSLRIVRGVSEALPLDDNSCDAVVCTLTLCSVANPERSMAEIRRVLKKPGGRFLFWEHVLSETNPSLASIQRVLSPLQERVADGCHLDRRTGETIRRAGFSHLDMEYLELDGSSLISPTVCGIATA